MYFFRVEEPSVCGPSWNHEPGIEWRPSVDDDMILPEHSLLPLWLSVWRWMCGEEAEEWTEHVPEVHAEPPELIERFGMLSAPWTIPNPSELGIPTFVAKPSEIATAEGFPSEIAALRAAYAVAHEADISLARTVFAEMIRGSDKTFCAGDAGAVVAYHASLALQAMSPQVIVEADLLSSLATVLISGESDLTEVGVTVARNHAAFLLGDMTSSVVGTWSREQAEDATTVAQVSTAITALTHALNTPELHLCQAAAAEGLGFAVSALKSLAAARPTSQATQLVETTQSALQEALANIRSRHIADSVITSVATEKMDGPRNSAMSRLHAVASHVNVVGSDLPQVSKETASGLDTDPGAEQMVEALRNLNASPRQNSLETYVLFALHKSGVGTTLPMGFPVHRRSSIPIAWVSSIPGGVQAYGGNFDQFNINLN